MSNFSDLSELEDAVIRYIQSKKVSHDKLVTAFVQGPYNKMAVNQIIRALLSRGYIKLSENKYSKKQIMFLDEPYNEDDWEHVYLITPLGTAYLARSSANFTSYSNITNSNIAHLSPGSSQSIDINELPPDIQEKILEFDKAVGEKDNEAMKKIFSYIADKSVDVAIALATGALLR